MKRVLLNAGEDASRWVAEQTGGSYSDGAGTSIALVQDDRVIAACLYEQWNGANVQMHVASVAGKQWATREFLYYAFAYPFVQLKVRRVTGLVASSNTSAIRLDEHLGFTLEATLKDAHPDGDLLVYVMRRECCRWLNFKGDSDGKIIRTSHT